MPIQSQSLRFIARVFLALMAAAAVLEGQSEQSSFESTTLPNLPDAAGPSITFNLEFPGSAPESYAIEFWSNGRVSYESRASLMPDAASPTSFHYDFAVSPQSVQRVFALGKEANYFAGKVDASRKLAFTGKKTLAYRDGRIDHAATYNYSDIKPIQLLTAYFQSIGATLEFVRQLEYDLRYQKLALDTELKNMEQQVAEGQLQELQAAKAILRKIAADPSVIKTTRSRAQHIAELSNSTD